MQTTEVYSNRSKHEIVRFSDAQWLKKELLPVTVGGVGGIGSWLSFFLGRIGTPMCIYDIDIVDETNLGGQLYSSSQKDTTKTSAAFSNIIAFSNFYDVICLSEFSEESNVDSIVFSCFDNMATRKLMFEKWASNPNAELFIDGRMLAESFQIYCVTPDKKERYRETLFGDEEVADLACSYKATSHCGAMIASNMIGLYTNYLTNKNLGRVIRNLPFNINVEIPMMYYEALD